MKKQVIVLILLCCLPFGLYSQSKDCSCYDNLVFLDQKVQKTPAYKLHKKAYQLAYKEILEQSKSVKSLYDCHVLLNTLLLSLNDNHSRVYSTNQGLTQAVKNDPDQLADFKNSDLYTSYPRPEIDLDSLTKVLQSSPKEAITGLYSIKEYLTIGVYKHEGETNYQAVVLESEVEHWEQGELIYTLIPLGKTTFLSVGGSLSSKRLIAYTEKIEEGFFHYVGFKKEADQQLFSLETLSDNTYDRLELSDDITYLKIGSFNSWYPALGEAEDFYKSLEGTLSKPHLIVDLRNNGGGGERNSDLLYKQLKRYAKSNKVYVLINHRTLSNAERFALQLRALDNCLLFGSSTNGTLAYEIKNSTYNLTCGDFVAVLTSKKDSKYIDYESLGVEPDQELSMQSDWVEQLLEYISKSK
jgi:hypothetical protein